MSEFEGETSILLKKYDDDNNTINLEFKKLQNYKQYMLLKITITDMGADVNAANELKKIYVNSAKAHNSKITTNNYPDAGFDLFSPNDIDCEFLQPYIKLDFNIRCSANMVYNDGTVTPTGFYMYPRSSTGSKTPLRLANSVGIIDSGYRGNLISVFDCIMKNHRVSKYDKLIQICAPSLVPIYVEICDTLNDQTDRGSNGFGSTGI